LTTVHVQDLTGDERGGFEIYHRDDHVVDLAHASDGVQLGQELVGGRICIGVWITPSATALERIPCAAYSIASALVTASSPPLVSDASAAGTCELAWSTRLVEMFTMCPPPSRDSIAATAARETSKNPRRLTPVTAS
jgi:hypothetical protein